MPLSAPSTCEVPEYMSVPRTHRAASLALPQIHAGRTSSSASGMPGRPGGRSSSVCLQEGAADPKLLAGGRSADPSGLAAVQRMLHQQQSSRSAREAQTGAGPGHSLSRTATGLSRDSRRSLRKSPTSSSLGEHQHVVCLPRRDLTAGLLSALLPPCSPCMGGANATDPNSMRFKAAAHAKPPSSYACLAG